MAQGAATKNFKVILEGNLYKMHWEGGGEFPKSLSGLYTSEREALAAGAAYIRIRDGVKKNAKDNARKK